MTAVGSNRALHACTTDIFCARGNEIEPEFFSTQHCRGLIRKAGEFPGRGLVVVDWTTPAVANRGKPPPFTIAAYLDPPPEPPPIDSKPPG